MTDAITSMGRTLTRYITIPMAVVAIVILTMLWVVGKQIEKNKR